MSYFTITEIVPKATEQRSRIMFEIKLRQYDLFQNTQPCWFKGEPESEMERRTR